MSNSKQNGSIIAIITMMFLYAMISFVTNLAAPIGVIWKSAFDGDSANTVGMLGNAMNFLAYLFMGIPAGKMLSKVGYKKTALIGIGIGFLGVLTQFCSGLFADAKITGFVSGAATEPIVAKAILGSRELGSYLSPNQVLNYVEAHDNYNLHDLLATLHPDQSSDQIMRKVETATAMNLLMQGMSFMEIGQEFGRTKLIPTGEHGQLTPADRERAMNSYNAPDSVNQINWDLINERQESIDFVRQIIRLKTQTSAFSYPTYEEVYRHVFVHTAAENSGWIVYEIHGGPEHLLVVFNAKGTSFYFENAGNLEMLVTNSRSKESNVIDNTSVAVLKVLS